MMSMPLKKSQAVLSMLVHFLSSRSEEQGLQLISNRHWYPHAIEKIPNNFTSGHGLMRNTLMLCLQLAAHRYSIPQGVRKQ